MSNVSHLYPTLNILIEIVIWAFVLVLLQAFVEWFSQSFSEFTADVIGFGAKQPLPPLWVATITYFSVGALLGALSLLAVPALVISSQWVRILNVVVSPFGIAFLVALFGAWFKREPIDRFIKVFYFAYCVALAMVLARLAWGFSSATPGT